MIAVASPHGTLSSSHFFIVRAFNIVSAVVNVLLAMTTAAIIIVNGGNIESFVHQPRVVSATKPDRALATSTGSTFAKNRRVLPLASLEAAAPVRKASKTNSGPRSKVRFVKVHNPFMFH